MKLDKYSTDVYKCGKRRWRNYHSFRKNAAFSDLINDNISIENPKTNLKIGYGNSVVWKKIVITNVYGTELHIKLAK